MADLSQWFTVGAVGAVAGGVLTWLGGIVKSGVDHWLDQRKKRTDEEQTIRAEQRAQEREQAQREEARIEKIKQDEAVLVMYKTQLKGTKYLPDAGTVVEGIHSYFVQRPQYLNATNRAFLEKYPRDFRSQVCFAPDRFPESTLDKLKRDVDSLHAE